jgi:hypothetical protein
MACPTEPSSLVSITAVSGASQVLFGGGAPRFSVAIFNSTPVSVSREYVLKWESCENFSVVRKSVGRPEVELNPQFRHSLAHAAPGIFNGSVFLREYLGIR